MESTEKKTTSMKENCQSTARREEKSRKRSTEKKTTSMKKDCQSTVRREEKLKAEKLTITE